MNKQGLITNGSKFRKEHKVIQTLASGGEGKVSLWKNKSTSQLVAVKEPVIDNPLVKNALMGEIEGMKKLGQHSHIVRFLGSAEDWQKLSPAIFYEFCDLGDVQAYNSKLLKGGMWIPELTIWKFILDMAKGLDYLHDGLDVPYVHGDLKPGNILVSRSPGDDTELPIMPTFKLADISHLTPYIAGRLTYQYYHTYRGTWEYGPPAKERKNRLAPPVDIWAIGASLQTLAWGIMPVMSSAAIKRRLKAEGYPSPTPGKIQAWMNNEEFRKTCLPLVWRPLNASFKDQLAKYDMLYGYPPYSDPLNDWYAMCLNEDPKARVTAKVLKKYFIPLAERQIQLFAAKQRRDDALKTVKNLKTKAAERRNSSKAKPDFSGSKEPPAARAGPAQKPDAEKRNIEKDVHKGKMKAVRF